MKKITKLLIFNLMIFSAVFVAKAQTAADSATVTFQVDMSSVSSGFTTPEVNGTFNNWCGACWSMSDSNGDNIWEVSAKVLKNTAHEFKFSADGFSIEESLFSGDPCTVTNFGYTNRTLNVSGDTTLGVVCWESCSSCNSAPSSYNVTFQVDMNGVSGFTTPEVNGTFNGWCGNCWAMSDADGDNVWDFTTLLAPGSYDFKFSADSWGIQESLDSSLSCVLTTIDSLGNVFVNREVEVIASDVTLDVVAWNGCASAVVPGCTDAAANNYNVSANTDDGSCMYDITLTVDLNCESFTPGYVAATGPSDGWSCGTYALTDGDANGVWEGTFSLPAGTFEYIYCADGWAQNETAGLIAAMQSGSTCAPVTDNTTYANRLITVGALTTVDTWGSCGVCISGSVSGCTDPTATNYNPAANVDDGSCTYTSTVLTITTTVCSGATSVALTGPWWGWDPIAGPVAVDNGNGTWTFTLDPAPTADMEYLLVVDGVQEDLVAAGTASGDWSCTPITDYSSYANRQWVVGSGDVTNTYNTCGVCGTVISGCTDATATNYDPTATVDDGSCVYGPILTQIDLPVTWDDTTVDYTVTPFGGTTASLTADPTNASNTVLMVDRTAGSPTWAGTTLGTNAGFATDIPLTLSNSTMSVSVWSPQAGTPIRLKVEDSNDPTHTCETEVNTTASGWQVLVFDFSNEAPGTQPLSIGLGFGWTYNKASVFCDFGNVPSASTIYYLDDVTFGGVVSTVLGCTDPTATNYNPAANVDDGSCTYTSTVLTITTTVCSGATSVALTGPWWGWDPIAGPVAVDNGNGTWTFTLDPAPTADMEYLLVVDGVQEDLVAAGTASGDWSCTPITDYSSYANRQWVVGSGDVTNTYNTCGSCITIILGCTDPLATNYDPTATVDDGSCIAPVYGCTDPLATNYYAGASIDDGSCTYVPSTCTNPEPTNAYISELIHDRARVNWDNMNDANCMVDQYRIRYREVGTTTWSSKTMAGSGLCVFGLNTTSKKILGLTASTTYEYYMKAWYCGGGVSAWSAIQNFTTADECQNVINFVVSSPTTTKASFTWDTTAAYSFARIKLRPDTTGGVWTTAGGFGVFYPALSKSKNGLTPGQTYRASARTWCNPTGGTYRSAGWTSPIFWTQPTSIRVEGGSAINNLDVYPNPSRDIFNVSFTSEDAQDLEVRIINVVGEVVYTESLGQFVGEYTKQVDLATYTKGVYFLEITTNNGVVNKKLILQ